MKSLIQDTAEHLTSISLHLFVNCLLMPFTSFKRSEIYFFSLRHSWLIVFQVYSKMIQLYIYSF